jgi:hypothetical protein
MCQADGHRPCRGEVGTGPGGSLNGCQACI